MNSRNLRGASRERARLVRGSAVRPADSITPWDRNRRVPRPCYGANNPPAGIDFENRIRRGIQEVMKKLLRSRSGLSFVEQFGIGDRFALALGIRSPYRSSSPRSSKKAADERKNITMRSWQRTSGNRIVTCAIGKSHRWVDAVARLIEAGHIPRFPLTTINGSGSGRNAS